MSRTRNVILFASLSAVSWSFAAGVGSPIAHASTSTSAATIGRTQQPNLTYTVKPGDYLFGIATKLSVRVADLLAQNHLALTSLIYPGMELVVPAGGTLPATANPTPAPSTAAPTRTPVNGSGAAASYVVLPGDYLFGIATKTGVSLKSLLAANDMSVASVIVPGQTLTLPAGAKEIASSRTASPATAGNGATRSQTAAADKTAAKLATVVAFLRAQVGKPYVFNTAGPDSYDCSGLVRAAYLTVGISLPHQSMLQSYKGTAVDWRTEALRAGDLVFQYSAGKSYISHVGIALDANTWIQAAGSGRPVKIGPLPADDRIVSVRRIIS